MASSNMAVAARVGWALRVFMKGLPWFVRGDADGFFALFVDNLLQLMLIAVLCTGVCGMPAELVYGRILPGAALSVVSGNLFYAWQARRLATREGRTDRTALPYGINTVSLIAYVFLVMGPVYFDTHDPELAWKVGLFACLASALMESAGALIGEWLRRRTPRAALLSTLAGIAITFISMGFVFQIFAAPRLALIPALVILVAYASRVRLPFGVPAGVVAIGLGVASAWLLRAFGYPSFEPPHVASAFALHVPRPTFGAMLEFLINGRGVRYFSVIVPMGLFNVIGSLQNLESAEAAGDRYEARSSMLANGVGTAAAACFGSPFPTTIYIGHPAWKAMGARWGYSILNGAAIGALCVTGAIPLVLRFIPLEVTLGILLWVGIIITAQAFEEVPKRHGLAVALGLVPSLAAWAEVLIETSLRAAGTTLQDAAPRFGADLHIHGVLALSQGFILSSTVLCAILVHAIEREFTRAAAWALVAAGLSFFGLVHAYRIGSGGVENRIGWAAAPDFALLYALAAALLWLLGRAVRARSPR